MYRYERPMPERPDGFVTTSEVSFPIPENVPQPKPGDVLLKHKEWRRQRQDPYWSDKGVLDMWNTSQGSVHSDEVYEKSRRRPFNQKNIDRNPTCERVGFVNESQPTAFWKHGISCGTRVPTTAQSYPWPNMTDAEKEAMHELEQKQDNFKNKFGDLFRPFDSKDPLELPRFNYQTTYNAYHDGSVPEVREAPIPRGWSHRRELKDPEETENFEFANGAFRLRASTAPNGLTRNPVKLGAAHRNPQSLRPVSSAFQSRQMMTHNENNLNPDRLRNAYEHVQNTRANNVTMIDTASAPDVNYRKSQCLTYQFGIKQLDDHKPVIGGQPHPVESISRSSILRKRLFHQENNPGKPHLYDVPQMYNTTSKGVGGFYSQESNTAATTC